MRPLLSLTALLLAPLATLRAADLYVSPAGDDANRGGIDHPFATLERARDAIRELKRTAGLPAGGPSVHAARTTAIFMWI